MGRELWELDIEIEKTRQQLNNLLCDKKEAGSNDLAMSISEKLDKLIVRYIKITKDNNL